MTGSHPKIYIHRALQGLGWKEALTISWLNEEASQRPDSETRAHADPEVWKQSTQDLRVGFTLGPPAPGALIGQKSGGSKYFPPAGGGGWRSGKLRPPTATRG